jgi:hypothetical protein
MASLERKTSMLTRHDLAELSRAHEKDMVLSVYLARHNSDPGDRGAWRLRLEGALEGIRSCLEVEAPEDLPAFETAAEQVHHGMESFGRVLPSEGWSAFATEERLWHAEALPFPPFDAVRWRQGIYAAPYVRTLKASRPVILAVVERLHATAYRYLGGELGEGTELHADWPAAESSDVGISKRASTTSGVRGVTRTDFTQRAVEENARRLRIELIAALEEMAGAEGGVVIAGTPKATSAVRKELEERMPGRVIDAPELSFNSPREELLAAVAAAASTLTRMRQARLLDATAAAGDRASRGWNQTYRALAAGAVDTLLVARGLIESSPDDAERLVRLALAQGGDVEELGEELGERLMQEAEGVAARLRYRLPT